MSDAIEALIAKQEIYELSCRYMRGLDRHDAQLMRDQFWEDGWCEYGFYDSNPSEFIDFCMQALQDHVANQHMIGNVLVDVPERLKNRGRAAAARELELRAHGRKVVPIVDAGDIAQAVDTAVLVARGG